MVCKLWVFDQQAKDLEIQPGATVKVVRVDGQMAPVLIGGVREAWVPRQTLARFEQDHLDFVCARVFPAVL